MQKATDKQIALIRRLAREQGWGEGDQHTHRILGLVGREHFASLRVYEASALISRLQPSVNEAEYPTV